MGVIELVIHPDGVILPVRAAPGSRVSAVRGEQNGALKVAVTQVAEKGKANRAVIDVLCKSLRLRVVVQVAVAEVVTLPKSHDFGYQNV